MEAKRRLAAIMFTDIEGYSALTQENESLAIRILDKHRELMRPVFARHRGHEVKTMGDGFLVEFESALDAIECAAELQDVLRVYNETAVDKISVRAGIHVGDVIHRDGDVYGDAVNIAARIETIARGGEVCISEQVYVQVRNKMSFRFVLLEPRSLKNISVPIEVYKLQSGSEAGSEPTPEPLGQRFAVLPLANLSPDSNDEYLADAMTDELNVPVPGSVVAP
ncbi:MAG: adenylate/guanylate cyclase domain-containing protein, partial [Thaumarchaeota archaeon]|nr:adenylate/guanylate cyclase domain-containing protein [Nitrososphaerota archaeon]